MSSNNLTLITLVVLIIGCSQENSVSKEFSQDKSNNSSAITQAYSDIDIKEYKTINVKNIVTLFNEIDINKISDKIKFPLYRKYPIPPIKNKKEFIKRFNEIFDDKLCIKIANSDSGQWTLMGWKGIMLDNGTVWMESSFEGRIIAVNYMSNIEKELRKELIKKEKRSLHSSLRDFESPKYKVITEDYLIRIDKLTNGKYRYASWDINKKESLKPDLILENGEFEYQGSGGNHTITFLNKNYQYKIFMFQLRERDSNDILFEIEKDHKVILSQSGSSSIVRY